MIYIYNIRWHNTFIIKMHLAEIIKWGLASDQCVWIKRPKYPKTLTIWSRNRDLNQGPPGTKQPLYHLSYHPLTKVVFLIKFEQVFLLLSHLPFHTLSFISGFLTLLLFYCFWGLSKKETCLRGRAAEIKPYFLKV